MKLTTYLTDNKWARTLLTYLSGASCVLAFAPYNLWFLLPIALAFSLWQSKHLSSKASFYHWLSFGFGYFSFGISWVHVSIATYGGVPLVISILMMAVLAGYLALFPALAGYLSQRFTNGNAVSKNLLLFPAFWTLTEWLRGWVLTGFPWLWSGYSQTDGPLLPLASSIGVIGLSFIIALIAGSLALLLSKRWQPLMIIIPVVGLCIWLSPKLSNIEATTKTMKVALVQGNIAQSMKWKPEMLWPTLIKYMDLTRKNFDAEVIIWPEGAIPVPEVVTSDFLNTANQSANLNDAAIITGLSSYNPPDYYNALIVLGNAHQAKQTHGDYRPHGENEYHKHHLLPIGEFVPFGDLLRPLAPLFNLPMSSFSRGNYRQADLQAHGYKLAPAICFEIAFPQQVRDNLKQDTDVLLTVSNDAWFGKSIGPLQHMQIAQMRAVELGRPLLRGTNNGVTAVVDWRGKITEQLPQFKTDVLRAEVPLVKGETLFYRIGQWPVLGFCLLLVLLAVALNRNTLSS